MADVTKSAQKLKEMKEFKEERAKQFETNRQRYAQDIERRKARMAALDAAITLKVAKGNQFVMPNLVGQFWVDVEPTLRALGWTGVLVKGPDVQNSGQRSNAVVTQSPTPGTGVNFGGPITLAFAS